MRKRLVRHTANRTNLSGDRVNFPTELDALGVVVDRGVVLLRRSSSSAPNQVDDVAVVFVLSIVTLSRDKAEAKGLTGLLTNLDAGNDPGRTVTLSEFIRIGIGTDRALEVLLGTKAQILDVIGPNIICLTALRGSLKRSEAIPCNAERISAIILDIKDTLLRTSFIKTLTNGIPYEFSQYGFLR